MRSIRGVFLSASLLAIAACGDDVDVTGGDTTPPETSIDSAPPTLTNTPDATVEFSGSDNVAVTGFECQLDGAAFVACTSPQSYTGLTDGAHTFAVRALDGAGNFDATPADASWTIDSVAPAGTFDVVEDTATTTTVNANVTATDGNGPIEMMFGGDIVGGGLWEPMAASSTLELTSGDALKTVTLELRDSLGNVSAALSDTVDLDTGAPTGTIDVVPTVTAATTVAVDLTATDPNTPIEMRLSGDIMGGGVWESFAASVNVDLTSGEGTKTVSVEYRDALGNATAPLSDTVELDQSPPIGTIDVVPAVSGSLTVDVDLTATDGAGPIEMQLGGDITTGGSWVPFAATAQVDLTSGDGTKTVTVDFRDALGNTAVMLSDTVELDQSPPVGTIDVVLAATGSVTVDVDVTVSDANGPIEIMFTGDVVNEGAWRASAATMQVELSAGDGTKTVTAEFRDALLNTSGTTSNTVDLDGSPPVGTITIVQSITNQTLVDVDLTATEPNGPVEVRFSGADVVGGGSWIAFAASLQVQITTGDNSKQIDIEFRDAFLNTSAPLSDTVILDQTPPDTQITGAPPDPDIDTSPTFGFSMTDANPGSYECRVDSGAWVACGSPETFLRLAASRAGTPHDIEVRAVDAAGNVDASPATHAWSITRDWTFLTAASRKSCGVSLNGNLWCWGDNREGSLGFGFNGGWHPNPLQVGDDEDWRSVAGSWNHSCAVKTDNTIWCMGLNFFGEVGDTSGAVTVNTPSQVGTDTDWDVVGLIGGFGANHNCALKGDQSLWCWGYNSDGQLGNNTSNNGSNPIPVEPAPGQSFISVTQGTAHTCAVRDDSTLWCWGRHSSGQLGLGSADTADRTTPEQVIGASDWTMVTAGGSFTCGIRDNGIGSRTAWCWGRNNEGQLGDNTTTDSFVPVAVAGGYSDWITLFAGDELTCGLRDDSGTNTIWCWGLNDVAQLGVGDTAPRLLPTRVGTDTGWQSVSAGEDHACGIRPDDDGYCWGTTMQGELGNGEVLLNAAQRTPALANGPTDWATVTAGYNHNCALRTLDNSLWCWGQNWSASLGTGHRGFEKMPTVIDSGVWSDISTRSHSCAVRGDGTLWCWGYNVSGQLGIGTNVGPDDCSSSACSLSILPESLGATDWVRVAAGGNHTCGIREDVGGNRTLWCWGDGGQGALGHGTGAGTESLFDPTPVAGGYTDWDSVSAGSNHTCGIRDDGAGNRSLWCWGYNFYGGLGLGTSGTGTNALVPTEVGDTDWAAVSAGALYTCATKTTGTAWCWGYGFAGKTGPVGQPNVPTQIDTATNWSSVVTSPFWHTCGLRTDGTLWCWGDNSSGQLCNDGAGSGSALRQSGTDTDWASVSLGNKHTCAVKTNGEVHCCGWNIAGQLGSGDPWYESPQLVP